MTEAERLLAELLDVYDAPEITGAGDLFEAFAESAHAIRCVVREAKKRSEGGA